jgi:NAD(P)-dependent dehydrogenase (short-subunit alcohol dehydrogenase family)
MAPESPRSGRFGGQRVVVTGAASGIGQAMALAFAREGGTVACLDLDGEGAESTAALARRDGAAALALQCDVRSWAETAAACDRLAAELGGVHVLVANAGGSRGEAVPFLELDEAAWARMIDRNLTTAFVSGRVFAAHMAEHGGGAIVFTSSQLSNVVRPGLVHYAAAKGAVQQLVRGMAVDLAPHGIRVNAVAPGPTLTPGNRTWFERRDVAAEHERLIPLGRVAEPHEIAGAALYLASDEASFTTGTTLTVDGGYTIV